jgi:hypothetical protein
MIKIQTYSYTGERNRVDKTDYLTEQTDYEGVLNAQFDVLHPVVRFRTNTPVTFNYAYIDSLGRWYFVDNIKQDGNICSVSFSVDVLHTYKDKIKQLQGVLVEGENTNGYASNRQNVYDTRPKTERIDFSENKTFEDKGNIIMVTIKGNV